MKKLKLYDKSQKLFFTSDTHFSHENIIKYCFRSFRTIDEMNQKLIENWNKIVGKNDIIFHLGDFIFTSGKRSQRQIETEKILQKLNGHKYLIIGNHDKEPTYKATGWIRYDNILEVHYQDYHPIILCHYPMIVWNKSQYGSYHFYGHCHGTLGTHKDFHRGHNPVAKIISFRKMMDVGVDSWDYRPVSFDTIKLELDERNWTPRVEDFSEWK